jgi:hypothetical protein
MGHKYIIDIVGDLPAVLLKLDSNDNMAVKCICIYANSHIIAQHYGSRRYKKLGTETKW